MLQLTYQSSLIAHIAGGSCGLLLFWLPMLTRKGSTLHRRSGHWYSVAMLLVAASALALSASILIDPLAVKARSFTDPQAQAQYIKQTQLSALFLAQLAIMLYVNLHLGRWVLRVRAQRAQLRSMRHLLPVAVLLLMSLYTGALGIAYGKVLLQGFAALGLFTAISNWRYIYAAEVPARAWLAAHVRNIIPSGIAAYTAFFVVGASAWIGDSSWRLLPWVAPGVLGSVVIYYYSQQVLQANSRPTLNTAGAKLDA